MSKLITIAIVGRIAFEIRYTDNRKLRFYFRVGILISAVIASITFKTWDTPEAVGAIIERLPDIINEFIARVTGE